MRTRSSCTLILVPLAALTLLTGCSEESQNPTSGAIRSVPQAAVPADQAMRVVDAMIQRGAAMPQPQQIDCPAARCVQSVQTTTATVSVFENSGSAEIYAGQQQDNLLQIANITMRYAPDLPADQRDRLGTILKLVAR